MVMSKKWMDPPSKSKPVSEEDKRLNVLYAPFRNRDLNPVDYDSKLNYWKERIISLCTNNNCFVLNLSILEKEFTRNGKKPYCLSTVIEELIKTGDLLDFNQFLQLKYPIGQSWVSWFGDVAYSGLGTLFAFGIRGFPGKNETDKQKYVCIHYLKILTENIVQKVEDEFIILTRQSFIKYAFGEDASDSEEVNLLLHWLQVQKKCLIYKSEGHELIKLGENVVKFTESETVDILLEENRSRLVHTIETLDNEKKECVDLVRKYLRENNKTMAKSTLRKSKELDKRIEKKVTTLDNLDVLISRIHETKTDSEILKAYKFGLNALKDTMTGLNEDDVTNTMSELQEITDMQDDIQATLSQPVDQLDDFSLEDELNRILVLNNEEKETELNLPDVPSSPVPLPIINKNTKKILEPIGL